MQVQSGWLPKCSTSSSDITPFFYPGRIYGIFYRVELIIDTLITSILLIGTVPSLLKPFTTTRVNKVLRTVYSSVQHSAEVSFISEPESSYFSEILSTEVCLRWLSY